MDYKATQIHSPMAKQFLEKTALDSLIQVLLKQDYIVMGPQLQHNAIVYDVLTRSDQLPRGIRDKQNPGSYELEQSDENSLFNWANGPQAVKPLTFAPQEPLWSSRKDAAGELQFLEHRPEDKSIAILGVRACDLAALAIQDKHFLDPNAPDPYYQQRRKNLFLIAVNCSSPAQTCFCAATGDGPFANTGYDIVLTELENGFIISSGSDKGKDVVSRLSTSSITDSQQDLAKQQYQSAVAAQTRKLPDVDLPLTLLSQLEHPHWDDIGKRCLACGNCTSVCPTCFCHSEHDEQQLDGSSSAHQRQWDSCFNREHSYIHGIVIRPEAKTRYRQWLTHKFANWVKQYGQSGCVGCGRCITWCPVGIDVTQELAVLCGDSHG